MHPQRREMVPRYYYTVTGAGEKVGGRVYYSEGAHVALVGGISRRLPTETEAKAFVEERLGAAIGWHKSQSTNQLRKLARAWGISTRAELTPEEHGLLLREWIQAEEEKATA